MKKEVKKFDRKELFDEYNKRNNPFIFITTQLDITNIYNYCKIQYWTVLGTAFVVILNYEM